jgi:hypothetical protein
LDEETCGFVGDLGKISLKASKLFLTPIKNKSGVRIKS